MHATIDLSAMLANSYSMADGGRLPSKYTTDGLNISPHIGWQRVPREAKSIAIIMNDSDSSSGSWIHWGIFNIPPQLIELGEDQPKERNINHGIRQVVNDFGKPGYHGPLGATEKHKYVFTVCALDEMLQVKFNCTGEDLLKAMYGHVIEKALIRTYYGNKQKGEGLSVM
jgi:Raf kinase inhibitor-like YbhB/YbcL family protein